VRILIVDPHALVRRAVAALVEREPGFMVCGQAAAAGQGLAAIPRLLPDLLLAGLAFDAVDSLAEVQAITERHPALPVLVLSMHDPATVLDRALRAGARAVVAKPEMAATLVGAIHQVLADASRADPQRSPPGI
jgi:DNA-binding NarL/FixJ family response regulator